MVTPHQAQPSVKFIDDYCESYRDLFPEVRGFEYFKDLHLGLISDIKRKTLPAIAKVVNKEKLNFVLAIRSNHGMWLPLGQTIRYNKWRDFERVFSTGKTEKRYIREIIFGKKRETRYWQVTNDPESLPENSTWYIMTKIPKINFKEVGNLYGLRNWVEYGLKQSKNELGWADFRVTDYSRIERWWEMVMSAYLMVSLQSEQLSEGKEATLDLAKPAKEEMKNHPWWNEGKGWKNILNNLRLFIQPLCYFNLLKPWLVVLFTPQLIRLFCRLFFRFNRLINSILEKIFPYNSYFSSP